MHCTVSYCVAASEVSSVYNTPINWVGSPIDSVSNSSILDDSINTISNTTNKVGDWVGSHIDSVSNSYILDDSINTISNTTDKVGDWVGSQVPRLIQCQTVIFWMTVSIYHIKHHEQSRRLGRFPD